MSTEKNLKICLSDFARIGSISNLTSFPGAEAAAFVQILPNLESNSYLRTLWIYDQESGLRQLTRSGQEGIFCLPGKDSIIFSCPGNEDQRRRKKSGEWLTVFHRLDLKEDRESFSFEVALNVSSIEALSETSFLLSAMVDETRPDIENMPEEKKQEALERMREEADIEVCDELPFFADGKGFINKKRKALFLYDQCKAILERITPPFFETNSWAIHPSGREIAFTGVAYERMFIRPQGVYRYSLEDKHLAEWQEPGHFQISSIDYMGDDLLMLASPWNGLGPFPNHHLYCLSKETGSMQECFFHEDQDAGAKSVSDLRLGSGTIFQVLGDRLYYVTTQDASCRLNLWKKGETPEPLTPEHFVVDAFAVTKHGLLLTGCYWGEAQELYCLGHDGTLEQLSTFHSFTGDLAAKMDRLCVPNQDGFELRGFVLYPKDFDPSKRYPAILQIHGGPRAAYTGAFHHEMQVLAAQGYFVFFCNPRGSAGRGEVFADIQGRRGTIDYDDLMTWTDAVLDRTPAIDPDRLVVMGGSYGGYMTNWIITQTDRFCAAVSMRSISDLVGAFGATDYGVWGSQGSYGGTPWHNPEKLREQSPFSHAHLVTTPTLFIHAFEDYRCHIAGAMQMYSALQMQGTPARMCLFRGEGHELSRSGKPKNRLRRLEEILAWVASHTSID